MISDWIKLNKPWHEVNGYRGVGDLSVGVQIEVRKKGQHPKSKKLMRLLIGNINELGGICDDCTEIERDDVVIRYRVIATHDELDK